MRPDAISRGHLLPKANSDPSRLIIQAMCLAVLFVLLGGASFVWWYFGTSEGNAIHLRPADERSVEFSSHRVTLVLDDSVPVKPDKKGRQSPATLPAQVDRQFADVSLDGAGFELGILKVGEKAYSNRNYFWEN